MPSSQFPSVEELQSYFNSDLSDKTKEEKIEIEKKIQALKEKLANSRILPDIDLTEEESKLKETLSFKKLGIKNLDAFNLWLNFMDERNQITSVFAYEPETDHLGQPFLGKLLSISVFIPQRDKNGVLITSRDRVSGQITQNMDVSNVINLAIPPIANRSNPSSVSFSDVNGVSYTDRSSSLVRMVGDTSHNPTKDYIIKQQIRNFSKDNPTKRVIEIVEVLVQDYVAEITKEDGTITQARQLPVSVKLRVEYTRTRKTRKIQVSPREHARILNVLAESVHSWQQSSTEAMTLDSVLQKAAQTLTPDQLAQFLQDSTNKLKDKIKNNTIE